MTFPPRAPSSLLCRPSSQPAAPPAFRFTTRAKVISHSASIACSGSHRAGHRPDLSTLSSRELFRSRNNASGLGIGDPGPLGRLLIRGERGHDTIPELYPLPNEPVIDKPGRGAFAHTDFELLLRLRGIKNLVIAGVTTDVCVSSTMREANDRGFDCVLLHNGSAASEDSLHRAACDMVITEGGIFGAVATVEDVLKALPTLAGCT